MLLENLKKVCPYSNKEFIAKRSNQIFANKECRIAYHNALQGIDRRMKRPMNYQLDLNYKILNRLLGIKKVVKVNKFYLRGAGFSFKNITHVEHKENEVGYGIYDTVFYKINEDEYLINRR
jgi:hypothetical protein